MKYTVHRALTMLKTTKARITKELSDDAIPWVRVAKGQEESIRGIAIKSIQQDIQSHYDRIIALISNYMSIKSAVIQSNAGVFPQTELRKVSVCGKYLTVAEIIELQENIYGRANKNRFQVCSVSKDGRRRDSATSSYYCWQKTGG